MKSSNKVRVVIQARTNSSRLPAKVLLPLANNVPLFVFAVRRAQNLDHDVVLATSNSASDDVLATRAADNNIKCIRGSLDDVLSRFVEATSNLSDDDICVRLTCDNVFPDGGFINALIAEAATSAWDHYASSQLLPYGLSAELIRIGALRMADRETQSAFDREHVTPWIRANLTSITSKQNIDGLDHSNIRCTVDTLEDYLTMATFLAETADAEVLDAVSLSKLFITWRASNA